MSLPTPVGNENTAGLNQAATVFGSIDVRAVPGVQDHAGYVAASHAEVKRRSRHHVDDSYELPETRVGCWSSLFMELLSLDTIAEDQKGADTLGRRIGGAKSATAETIHHGRKVAETFSAASADLTRRSQG